MFLQAPQPGQVPGKAPKTCQLTQKAPYELKRERKFLTRWKDEFDWVIYEDGEMFCGVCRRQPNLADNSSSLVKGTSAFRHDTLLSHGLSKRHQHCAVAEKAKCPNAEVPTIVQSVQKMDPAFFNKMKNVMHTAYYVAKQEQPFTQFPELFGLINRTGGTLPDSYNSDKACARFICNIYDVEREKLMEKLRKAKHFSIMIDGATDGGTIENEAVYIRFMADEGPVNAFLSIQAVKHGNASGILDAIYAAFGEAGIDDWKERLVGFGSDGAAVNVGCRNGVAAQLLRDIPYLISIHCVAHRLELGVTKAIKENANMVQLQNTLKNLYDQYHYSPKALRELHLIAEALEEKVLKPSNLQGARWLPYVHRATKIVCDSYPVLLAHFEDMASMERNPKPSPAVVGRAKQVTGYLKSLHHLIFLHFMCDTLDHLALLSKEFQKDNNTVCQAVESLETCYWNLTALKTEMGPQMAKVYEAVKTNGEHRGVQFHVQNTVPSLEAERAAVIDERCERFRSLVTLLKIYLVLPVSTAVCERGFSAMKRVKSDWRTSLNSVQLHRLLFLSIEGPKLQDFDAGLVVERWWTCSQRQRRPGFNPWESRRRSEDTEDE
ncbi:zinc finger protein 862-like [Misgurnus anguillicaudatus]|uniref:zinc finger protein 862-like n=1 Tax=Misgurnus anguillicaudatus TaxID=75329 RepID=UPI003CCF59EA